MNIVKDLSLLKYSSVPEECDFKHSENLFGECENALQNKVFSIFFNEVSGDFVMYEKCDYYLSENLTYERCKQLEELFGKIAEKIKEFEK